VSILKEWANNRPKNEREMNSISIQVPSIIENIRMIESFIDNAKEKFHLDDDIYGNIMIAVTEAVNNAIKHGNSGDKSKNVSLTLSLNQSLIKFIVKDEGSGFNYENLPDPTSPENLEKIGGRGIFLMKHLSDEVEFKDKGRIVELSFYVNA
jgi:serine/threonine-protein kinase RsbW